MLALGCDHGGYPLMKEVIKYLEEHGLEYKNYGTYSTDSCSVSSYSSFFFGLYSSYSYMLYPSISFMALFYLMPLLYCLNLNEV